MSVRNFNNTTTVGTLTAPVASSAVSFTVTGFTGTPAAPFTATIDRNLASEEVVLVTAIAGGAVTATRGYDGTAAQSHVAGATIEHTAGAIEYTEANQHVNATTGVHGTSGSLVGTSGSQSLFNKTLVSPVLNADVSAGDAAVAFIPVGATARNLFRGVGSDGADKITVNSSGKITTVTDAAVGGNLTVTGTATVTGTLTATGAVTAGGGITVPTAKRVTLTDAPTAGTDAANKSYVDSTASTAASGAASPKADKTYVDGLVTSAGASRHLSYWWGSGTTFPTTGVITGDTFTRSDLSNTLWRYDGANWWASPGAIYGKAWRAIGFSGSITAGTNPGVVFDTARTTGGFTFVSGGNGPAATYLQVPLDGLYTVTSRAYATAGGAPCDVSWDVVRTRVSASDAIAVSTGFTKEDGQDRFPAMTDTVPLKAGDKVWARMGTTVTGTNYWGNSETAGVMLSATWIAPLNGVTPI